MSMDSGLNNEQLKKAMAQSTSEGMAKVLGKQESIDSGMEIRKLKADILNFKEWYREANAATRVQVLEKLNKIA